MPLRARVGSTARGSLPMLLVLLVVASTGSTLSARPLFSRSGGRPLFSQDPLSDAHSDDGTRYGHRYTDLYRPAFGTRLLDEPSTDMARESDPVLGVFYINRRYGSRAFTNVTNATQEGVLVALDVRLGRDFQATFEGPFLDQELTLADGFQPRIPGSVSAGTLEIKYRTPVEVKGWRSAFGFRTSTLKDVSHPLFTPGDWTGLNRIFASFSRVFRPWQRIHLVLSHTNIPQPQGLTFNEIWHAAFVSESDVWKQDRNFVRLITEVHGYDFETRDYNFYGDLQGGLNFALHSGLRIRTGIVEIELAGRRITTPGFREYRIGFRKKF